MLKSFVAFSILTIGSIATASSSFDQCAQRLDLVSPLAPDEYERLGFEGPVSFTDVTTRFRTLVHVYKDHPHFVQRFADAYDAIKMTASSGQKFDSSPLPLAALRRAHGEIFGNPHSGRFTAGYGLDPYAHPTMDENVMMRDLLHAEPNRLRLMKLDQAARPDFEFFIYYFGKNIQRVGIEGGFEDTIVASQGWVGAAHGHARRRMIEARNLFVAIFGGTYVAAVTEPRGAAYAQMRELLAKNKLPPLPRPVSIEERLVDERDPRTFLRHVVHHFRQQFRTGNRKGTGGEFKQLAWLYEHRFFVDEAQFIQHLLLFATVQWTGRDLNFADPADHRLVTMLLNQLRQRWITEPAAFGQPPRWFDYASVLWDAHYVNTKTVYTGEHAQPDAPTWSRLREVESEHPDVLAQLRIERAPRPLPSEVLPW